MNDATGILEDHPFLFKECLKEISTNVYSIFGVFH